MLLRFGNEVFGKKVPSGAAPSKAFAIYQGSPFFLQSACKSRAVKSIPIPISS